MKSKIQFHIDYYQKPIIRVRLEQDGDDVRDVLAYNAISSMSNRYYQNLTGLAMVRDNGGGSEEDGSSYSRCEISDIDLDRCSLLCLGELEGLKLHLADALAIINQTIQAKKTPESANEKTIKDSKSR